MFILASAMFLLVFFLDQSWLLAKSMRFIRLAILSDIVNIMII